MKIRQTELLAPAKDLETGVVAINSGADAVYIGASSFGARHLAGNKLEDIKKLVDYAHKFNVKIHVTINTILTDDELVEAKKLIQNLYEIGVDAIIVQDMGLVNLAIKNELPPIVLHASTQCNNRGLEKVKFLREVGFSRAILARELSVEKIGEICQNTDIEIETFIHGALCVSYSGQCYLSCSAGGRSANRGECAQPCRKKYTLTDEKGRILAKDKHLLSLKDFNASGNLRALVEAGVKSFKIEGRLKDKNYVKNVVAFYRAELDKYGQKTSSGKIFADFEPNVSKSFNRGFTSYFLNGREKCFNFSSPKMRGEKLAKVKKSVPGSFVLDKKLELTPQDGLCYFKADVLEGCLVNSVKNGEIFINKNIKIPVGTMIYRNFDAKFDKMLSSSKITRKLRADFTFKDGVLTVEDEDGNVESVRLENFETPNNPEKMKEIFTEQLKKTGESDFYAENIEILSEVPFMPKSQINEVRRTILDKLIEKRIKNYKREVQKPLNYAKYVKVATDYRENIHNSEAEKFYEGCGCKVLEHSLETSREFRGKELMRTKHCLKYAFDICKSPTKLFLTDEKGKKYPLKFDCRNCEMVVLAD